MSSIMGLPADDLLKPPGFDTPITEFNTGDLIVKSARETERAVIVDKALNLVDQYTKATFLPDGSVIDTIEDVEGLRDAIEDLKEGEQE